MKRIIPITKAVTKIAEVIHWAGALLMLALSVCALAFPALIQNMVSTGILKNGGRELNVYGFEILNPVVNGSTELRSLVLFGFSAAVILSLTAMIFRNLNLTVKKAQDGSPFQPDTVRMMREIGIFAIAIPVAGLIMSIASSLVLSTAGLPAEITVRLDGLVWGIIVLCLTQFFVYGTQLQEDVDGLV